MADGGNDDVLLDDPEEDRHTTRVLKARDDLVRQALRQFWRLFGINPDNEDDQKALLADLRFLRTCRMVISGLAKNIWHGIVLAGAGLRRNLHRYALAPMMQATLTFLRLFKPNNIMVWFIGLGFGVLFGLVPYINEVNRPAVVVKDLHELDKVVVRGGSIDLVAHINHQRQCTSNIVRWLWRWRDDGAGHRVQQWVALGDPISPPVPLGDNIFATY